MVSSPGPLLQIGDVRGHWYGARYPVCNSFCYEQLDNSVLHGNAARDPSHIHRRRWCTYPPLIHIDRFLVGLRLNKYHGEFGKVLGPCPAFGIVARDQISPGNNYK